MNKKETFKIIKKAKKAKKAMLLDADSLTSKTVAQPKLNQKDINEAIFTLLKSLANLIPVHNVWDQKLIENWQSQLRTVKERVQQ